jgi:AraC-like DNA-binding protein
LVEQHDLGTASVTDPAARLGFHDAGQFCRFFTRTSGTPQSRYRVRVRQGLVAQPQSGSG